MRDLGSRDHEFIQVIKDIRNDLLSLAGVSQAEGWEAVPMQGSGTFAIESVISSIPPPEAKWLVIINGAYGERILKIIERHGIAAKAIRSAENELPDLAAIEAALGGGGFTHVAVVHCETTSGIMNPIAKIGALAKEHRCVYFVDSMENVPLPCISTASQPSACETPASCSRLLRRSRMTRMNSVSREPRSRLIAAFTVRLVVNGPGVKRGLSTMAAKMFSHWSCISWIQ